MYHNTYNIPVNEHDNVMGCFWMMMRDLEQKADNNLDRHFVDGYYKLWNRVTGDDKRPTWASVSNQPDSHPMPGACDGR